MTQSLRTSRPSTTYERTPSPVGSREQGAQAIVFRGPGWTWTLVPDQRWINARDKAREYGHYTWACGDRRWKVKSHSDKSALPHLVYMTVADGPVCDCMGFDYTGCCWHLGAVLKRLLRESRALGLTDLEPSPYEWLDGDELEGFEGAEQPAPVPAPARLLTALEKLYGD